MKKILSTFLSLFIVFSICVININSVFAQWDAESVGINYEWDCVMWMWQDCFKYERLIWVEEYQPGSGYTATSITQDAIFTATYLVWAILTIVIIRCWLWYIFASSSGKWKDANDYKNWLIKAALWAVLVRWAYAIVRLIQYIAKW